MLFAMQLELQHDSTLINEDLAPTTAEQRTWSVWNIASLWIGMAVCIPTYTLASSLVDKGWSWKTAVASVALGNLVVLLPMILNAHAGTRYGIPFPVLLRSSFGVMGANIPALMRAFVACGWFGIQTWIGGSAMYELVHTLAPGIALIPNLVPSWFGISTGQFMCFILFWLLNVVIIIRGIESIRVLETWSAPLLIAVGVALFGWAWSSVSDASQLFVEPASTTQIGWDTVFGAGLTSAVAFWGTLALNIPDFSRYARSQRDQIIGQSIGLPPTMTLFAFVGAIVTNASGIVFGKRIADPVQLLARIGGPSTRILSMVALLIATLTTNLAANVVSPANDFANLDPRRISFRKGALITAFIGILIMPWKLYNDAAHYLFTWLLGYGALLGSIGGIMIVDYFALRRCSLNVSDLYRRDGEYRFARGYNPFAIVALIVGIAFNVPGFLTALGVYRAAPIWTAVYDRAWFVSLLLSGSVYYRLMKSRGFRRSP